MSLQSDKHVFIVGVGPGGIDCITLKAARVLQEADIVLYDALIDEEILSLTSTNCEKIFVGKSRNHHHKSQDEIHEMLRDYITNSSAKNIVRLKGGTPFVFGRGFEELYFLSSIGVKAKIVSGLSSVTSVPESFGIPLTDRKHIHSFRVVTGHRMETVKEMIPYPYLKGETLILMMAAFNIKEIASFLIEERAFPSTLPLLLMCNGARKNARLISLTLSAAKESDLKEQDEWKALTPMILYIGEAAHDALKLREEFL